MSGRAIETFLPMVPPRVTHNDLEVHRVGGGRATIGKSADLREAEAALGARVAKVAPDVPLSGPLRLQVRVCWPCGGRHGQGEPMRDKPDWDNFAKTFQDVLARCHVIRDDKDVVDARVAKAWADPAGIWFRVEEL
jgi:Holliday junction resolvase RusA-like endonuclease